MRSGNFTSRSCPRNIQSLHLFTSPEFFGVVRPGGDYLPKYAALLAFQAPNLRFLKLTTGWNTLFQGHARYMFNDHPEQRHGSNQQRSFDDEFWGYQLNAFRHLKCLELEIETVEEEKNFLDEKAKLAVGWRLPLASGDDLVLNPSKTRREGWYGPNISK